MTNKKKGSNAADLISSITCLFNEEDRADSVNYPKNLSLEEKIKHLKEIQEKHDDLLKIKAAFKAKYRKSIKSYYTMRYKIVNGVAEAEGVTSETTTEAEVEVTNETKAEAEENGVPSFWLNAMKNNKYLAEEITESDEDVLKYLEDIECTTIEDPEGLVLKFSFKSNPYFYHRYLEQTFHMRREVHVPIKAFGTGISWKPEYLWTLNEEKSFFNFFEDINTRYGEEETNEYMVSVHYPQITHYYDIAETIREMIPHAVSWFTMEKAPQKIVVVDLSDEEDEEEEETNEDTETESDEEDEDEEETETKKSIADMRSVTNTL